MQCLWSDLFCIPNENAVELNMRVQSGLSKAVMMIPNNLPGPCIL